MKIQNTYKSKVHIYIYIYVAREIIIYNIHDICYHKKIIKHRGANTRSRLFGATVQEMFLGANIRQEPGGSCHNAVFSDARIARSLKNIFQVFVQVSMSIVYKFAWPSAIGVSDNAPLACDFVV